MRIDKVERLSMVALVPVAVMALFGPRITTSAQKLYWVLMRGSEICPITQAWQGINENIRLREEFKKVETEVRLLRRDSRGLQEWDTPIGNWWFPSASSAGEVYFAVAQFVTVAYPGVQIKPGDVILDGGGYVGDWTKWALQAGASQAIIVEPATEQLECIRRNLADEIRQGRVVLCPRGLWDDNGKVFLDHHETNPSEISVTSARAIAREAIEVTTIDALVSELKLDRLDVVKLDVEGAELRAIRGARHTLNRFRPRLAIATEHTLDVSQNNRDVIRAIREVASFYEMRCGICASGANGLVPHTLYFSQRR